MTINRRLASLAISAALAAILSPPALAQSWPTRPVKLVVPYPAGGNVDGAARIVADKLQEKIGQPFIVENRAGAGGLVGGEAVARAEPDGYTFFVGANGPILFAPELAARRAYDWRVDFTPITAISKTPLVLQVHPSVPAKTFKEFLDLARGKPGSLQMASPGIGTTNHLLSELLQDKLGVKWVTVQYRGNAPATNDLIGGHIQFNLDQVSVALPFIQDGKTRALAVTGQARAPGLPDVQTFAEIGIPDIDGQTFTGLMAPAKTPPEIVAKMHAAMAEILNDPAVKAKFIALGAVAAPMSQEEFKTYLDKEDKTWIPLIRRLGLKAG
jgi:tripartite-type tricarboxylate transporter receptor subunit TctC